MKCKITDKDIVDFISNSLISIQHYDDPFPHWQIDTKKGITFGGGSHNFRASIKFAINNAKSFIKDC